MDVNTMWDRLIEMGVAEETLRVVTCINGYNEETLYDVLYAVFGVRSFDDEEE